VTAMPVQSTTDAGRSVLGEALQWALPRLVGYVVAAIASVVAFTIWAVVYTYVWPGMPPISIEPPAPPAVNVPASPAPTPPIVVDPDPPAVAAVPGERIPEGLPIASTRKLVVYLSSAAPLSTTPDPPPPLQKLGQIEDVQVGNDGKVIFYIVNVGDWFGSEKDIAVPSQKVTWLKGQNYGTKQDVWTPVVSMTKADVQNAPKQIFDPAAKKWLPAQ
jgi:PRC-barrel domain